LSKQNMQKLIGSMI